MSRTIVVNRIRYLWGIVGAVAVLSAIAATLTPARADDVFGGETPKTETPKTAAPKGAVATPKKNSAKFVWMKPAVAMKLLADKGLKRLKPTPTSVPWVLSDDTTVSEMLADFAKAAALEQATAQKAKEESVEISTDSETLSKAEARYSELKGYAEKPETIPRKIAARFQNPQEMMQALNKEVNDLADTINTLQPKVLGKFAADMPPPLKAAITDWMLARNKLILAYLKMPAKSEFTALDKQYRALADDANVQSALRSLGKKNRLSSPAFDQVQKAVAETEATAMSGEVPFYREGSLDSVGAILNETTPIVLRIESLNPNSPSMAPADLLAKAGIIVDPSDPAVTLTVSGSGKKRVIQCHQVLVPKLRFGKYMVENVRFLAMPDDAKDLGLQIVSTELNSFDQTPDRKTWHYKFAAKTQPAPDETKPDEKREAK